MDFFSWLALLFAVLVAYYTYSVQFSTRKMPPGPFVIPFGIGTLPAELLYRKYKNWRKRRGPGGSALARRKPRKIWEARPWENFRKLGEEYGDIVSVSVLGLDVVVLTTYDVMMEVANMDEYSIKFANEYLTYPRTFGKELGLIFVATTGLWAEMRKFTIRTLREFGFGKAYTMQSVIADEASLLAEDFVKKIKNDGGIVSFRNTFSLTVLNVMWCMVAGKRYEHDDPRLLKLMNNVFHMSKSATFGNPLELLVPVLMYFAPKALSTKLRLGARFRTFDEIHELSRSLVEERKEDGAYMTDPQNYIDVFLRKIHDTRNDKESVYTEEQLIAMIGDLLAVGSLTSNATLNYAVLFLILNPEMQRKIQDEIDSVISRSIAPTPEDFAKMPYFQAFILETHRCANVVPNPIPRIVPNDWKLHGYHIPKGVLIFTNHFGVNKEKSIWGDPDTFRPERFINDKGEFVADPRVIAFGFGKRICIGITLVESVMPIFLATLLQRFNLSVVPGKEPPTTEPEIGVSLTPIEFPALITLRES